LECLRSDVVAKRRAFRRRILRVAVDKLVFLDESGLNLAMGRTHAWVKRGLEFIERVPMNWGTNLTLLGAIRLSGWVVLNTMFKTANRHRFVRWLRTKLLPRLVPGDVLVMDNLPAHHDPRVVPACKARGVRAVYLPPYSPDLNPIEPGWALQKQYVRRHAPRHPAALRRVAHRARFRVTPKHASNWFVHAGYRAPLR
jgi:transposase